MVQQAEDKPSFVARHWLMFTLLGLAVLAFVIGRYSHIDVLQAFKGQKQTLEQRNQELQKLTDAQSKQISRLLTDAKVKEQAIRELKQIIETLNTEKAAVAADLAFYENLLSHKERIKSLKVFKVDATNRGALTDLKVVLAQRLEKAQIKSGQIELTLVGIQDESGKQIDLMDQFALNDRFEFQYFQVLDYSVQLPQGFIPTRLLVKLSGKGLKPKTVTEEFQWSQIVSDSTHNRTQVQSANTMAGESHVQLEKQ